MDTTVCGLYIRGGEWSFKTSGSRKILVQFHESCSLVPLAVMCVSHGLSIFRKAKGFEVPIRSLMFL